MRLSQGENQNLSISKARAPTTGSHGPAPWRHGYPHSLQIKKPRLPIKLLIQNPTAASGEARQQEPSKYWVSCVSLEAGNTFSNTLNKNKVRFQIATTGYTHTMSIWDHVSIYKNGSVSVFSSLPLTLPKIFPNCLDISFQTSKQEAFKTGLLPTTHKVVAWQTACT